MAGSVSGVASTFGLPNYVGELFALTPAETPLLSSIGGLTGGKQVNSTQFEWQTYDLADPSYAGVLEGADAPSGVSRVRANARNVVQIFQRAVEISYTKQATNQQFNTPTSAPFQSASPVSINGGELPPTDELTWQLHQKVKEISRDVNHAFWNGAYQLPTSNSTARQTRGLLEAISTNKVDLTSTNGAVTTATTTASATVTATHHFSVNDAVVFTSAIGTAAKQPVVIGRKYFISVATSTTSFEVSATKGGTSITFVGGTISLIRPRTAALTLAEIDSLAQLAFDNGGLSNVDTATICVNSTQRVAITNAFAAAGAQIHGAIQGNVGGVAVTQVETNFGRMNIMLDRAIPVDAFAVVSLDHLVPVFLNVPQKGNFFAEPLAKTGAADRVQLYGEIGLEYGNELAHAQYRGLAI